MLYYEIVRIDTNHPEDKETFEQIDKMVRRGWTKKAMEYLAEWDYGEDNLDAARANKEIRKSVLDDRSHGDRIIRADGSYALCCARCPSGLYDAYYLVCGISALAMASL